MCQLNLTVIRPENRHNIAKDYSPVETIYSKMRRIQRSHVIFVALEEQFDEEQEEKCSTGRLRKLCLDGTEARVGRRRYQKAYKRWEWKSHMYAYVLEWMPIDWERKISIVLTIWFIISSSSLLRNKGWEFHEGFPYFETLRVCLRDWKCQNRSSLRN